MRSLRVADLFCGAGGTSTGLLRAAARLGRPVDLLAVNHWDEAIATHTLNHPTVRHLHEDLGAIDPRRAVPDGRLDLLVASPECTSHSYSRGGRPISEQSRASAWHPLRWCDQLHVKTVLIENVPGFQAWGPEDGHGRPIRSRRGETYGQYLRMLEAMGYRVEARVLNAADYGAAQTRRRLFIIGVKGRKPIRWPAPTHAPLSATGSLFPGAQPWRGAKEIIDWSIRGASIFNRKKPHAAKTLERILIGGEKFWPTLRPYLPILRQHLLARSVDVPIPTVAAGGTHIGLAEPVLVQVSHGDNRQGRGRGNGGRVRPVTGPLGTLTGSRELGLAEAFIVGSGGAWDDRPQSLEEPLRPILTRAAKALAEPFVLVNRSHNVPKSTSDPLACLNTGNHLGLVAPMLLPQRTFRNMTADSVHNPLRTLTTKQVPALVEPHLTDAGPGVLIAFNGERGGQTPRTHSVEAPLPTVCASPTKGLVAPMLVKYSRTGGARSPEAPLDTLTTKDRYGLVTPELAAAADALPIGAVTPWGLKIGPHLYLDILFRMLRVHELAQGQGFPADYRFTGTVEEQIKQIGNAVEVHQAEALCAALLGGVA